MGRSALVFSSAQAWLEKQIAGRGLGSFLLCLLCLSLYLPGIVSLPPTDRDEARYIQASKQMLETGDYVHIRFQESPREKKPVGIYWLQSISAKLFGGPAAPIVAYRIPSVIAAILAVLLLYGIGVTLWGAQAGWWSAVMLASSLVVVAEAHLAKTDAVLLLCAVSCLRGLTVLYTTGAIRPSYRYLFWVGLGFGALVKGPVLPGLVGVTAATMVLVRRSWQFLKPLKPISGALLASSIVLPWVIALWWTGSLQFIERSISGDILPKVVGAHESHGGPPGFYLLTGTVAFWPWSFLAIPALWWAWQERSRREVQALLCWLLPSWVIIELVPTKLPHYSLPLFPALALLCSGCIHEYDTGQWPLSHPRLYRLIRRGWGGIVGVLWVVLLGASIYWGSWVVAGTAALIAAGVAVVVLDVAGPSNQGSGEKPQILSLRLLAVGWMTAVAFFGAIFPNLEAMWVSRQLVAAILPHRADFAQPVFLAGYSEPSAVVLLGTGTRIGTGHEAAEQLQAHTIQIAAVEDREAVAFRKFLGPAEAQLKEYGTVRGFNYSKGKRVTLKLYGLH